MGGQQARGRLRWSRTVTAQAAPLPAKEWDRRRNHIKAVAQALFADGGFNAVSTRDIVAAAGYRNTTLINYYFGSKAGLIDELIDDAIAALSRDRLAAMARMKAAGGPTVRSLLRLLATPAPPEGLPEEAAKSHTRFVAMLLTHHRQGLSPAGLFRKDAGTALCLRELRRLLPPRKDLRDRVNLVLLLFIAALVRDEVESAGGSDPVPLRIKDKEAVIDAAMAILSAP